MQGGKLILALFLVSVCLSFSQVNAQAEMLKTVIQDYAKKYLQNPQFQLNFIQEFIKGIIVSEIRLYDIALNHSKKLGSEGTNRIKEEVGGLVSALTQDQFKTLQDLIKDIKKEDPTDLGDLFSESTFNQDISQFNYQDKLAAVIVKRLFSHQIDTKEKLTESFKILDSIKKFLVKYRNANEEEVEKAFSYMKDYNKLKKSLEFFIDKLSDPKLSSALMKLALKYSEAKKSGEFDLMSMIQDDQALMNVFADKNWEEILKIKDQLTELGGSVYQDYYKKGYKTGKDTDNDDNDDSDDEEDGDDDEKQSKMSGGKIFLIVFGVISLIVIAFLIYRKFNQQKYNDGTYSENKQLYRASV